MNKSDVIAFLYELWTTSSLPAHATIETVADWVKTAAPVDSYIHFWKLMEEGEIVACPCCLRRARIWKRKINTSMARALITLTIHTSHEEYVHLFQFLVDHKVQHSDAPLLRHWGLIKELEGKKEDGNPRNGHYAITEKGRVFVHNASNAAKHVLLYNNTVLGFTEEQITIREALGDKFNYDELMNERADVDNIMCK